MDPTVTTPAQDVPLDLMVYAPWAAGAVALLVVLVAVVVVMRRRSAPLQLEGEVDPNAPPVQRGGALRDALSRTRSVLSGRLDSLLGRSKVDAAAFDELEEALLIADVGMPTAEKLLGPLRERSRREDLSGAELRDALVGEVKTLLAGQDPALTMPASGPWVLLVVGVNGSGKTTTIGKLAARLVKQGKRVMLAAADTYRAAAAEQLEVWAERSGADIVRQEEGADPGAVVYSALESALAKGHDVVIIDTAGRLQTRRPLMDQLSKIRRIIEKLVPDAPHETLLVLDGTMGQNGMSQARLFHEATPLTGAVVTKLDGTAKGGMILALASEMALPVKLVGVGEAVEDLRDFEPLAYADALT